MTGPAGDTHDAGPITRLTPSQIALRYGAFAVFATLANLMVQRGVLSVAEGVPGYAVALAAGTAVGLVVKFLLDKRWIFHDAVETPGAEMRKFSLYTLTGLGTTLVFWGTETAFWVIGQTHALRETGAVLGLATGYAIKYFLDRRFVFGAPGSNRQNDQQGGQRQ
jgi:putative flippase GtrA